MRKTTGAGAHSLRLGVCWSRSVGHFLTLSGLIPQRPALLFYVRPELLNPALKFGQLPPEFDGTGRAVWQFHIECCRAGL